MKATQEIQQGIQDSANQKKHDRLCKEQQLKQEEDLNKQKERVRQAETVRVLDEELKVCQEFDTCLNSNFKATDLTGLGIPRRCNSPARRYSLYNALAANQRIKRYKQQRGAV